MASRVNRWTDDKIKAVLKYAEDHTLSETRKHFAPLSNAQIHYWKKDAKRGVPWRTSQNEAGQARAGAKHKAVIAGKKGPKPKSGNGAAKGNGHVLAGLSRKDALTWLQRFHAAYMAQVRAETPSAVDVLEALGGGE